MKLGILGLSEGNGHPYSWSAICNGYDADEMQRCPFPVIPAYLAQHRFPDEAISDAQVTHIWTQDRDLSEQVARASRIEQVVDTPEQMIGQVDAVLLARDDAEHHFDMALPFLKAGLPIYIDKPLAYSITEARRILAAQQYTGQVFSCSALAYAKELQVTDAIIDQTGTIHRIEAHVIKSWEKYAIHIIDPVLRAMDSTDIFRTHHAVREGGRTTLETVWASGRQTVLTASGESTGGIEMTVFGDRGECRLVFEDTFNAFKAALMDFVAIVSGSLNPMDPEMILKSIQLVEAGISR